VPSIITEFEIFNLSNKQFSGKFDGSAMTNRCPSCPNLPLEDHLSNPRSHLPTREISLLAAFWALFM
jgi:hypothetical protein